MRPRGIRHPKLGTSYGQALMIWRHRLVQERRQAVIDAMRRVHEAAERVELRHAG